MNFVVPAFIVGNIASANFMPLLVPAASGALLPVCLLCICYVQSKVVRAVAGLLLGAVFVFAAQTKELQFRLPHGDEKRDALLLGQVVSLPKEEGDVTQFVFRVSAGPDEHRRFRLSWFRPDRSVTLGEHYRLNVRLSSPTGSVNFSAFDYEKWLFAERIHGRGYVLNAPAPERLGAHCRYCVAGLRHWIRTSLTSQGAGVTQATQLALALGDTSGLHHRRWETLNRTGTTHLLIVSGLHISLVATLAYLVCGAAGLPLRWRILFTLGVAFGYALIAGWGLPVQRAFVMTAAFFSATLFARHASLLSRLLLALVVVLLFDPLASLSRGFWLSFGIVGALIFALSNAQAFGEQRFVWLTTLLRAQWVATLSMLPLIGYFNHELPLAAYMVNLIAIPVVSFLIVPLVLLAVIGLMLSEPLANALLQLSAVLVDWLWQLLDGWADLNLVLPVTETNLALLCMAFLGAMILLMPAGIIYRWPGILMLLVLLSRSETRSAEHMTITFFDVGQGLSVLIETPDGAVIYDTGPAFSNGFSAATQILLPTLGARGYKVLQALVVSHSDNDHAGGEAVLVRGIPIKRNIRYGQCEASWRSGAVSFLAFDVADGSAGSDNSTSCLLLVSLGEFNMLLTGDIEARDEYRLLNHPLMSRLEGDVTLMSAPHHGSNSSSTPGLLNRLQPSIIVVSAGFRNRFGHPARRVLERYTARGIAVFNTAKAGAVRVRVQSSQLQVAEPTPAGHAARGFSLQFETARSVPAGVWRRTH